MSQQASPKKSSNGVLSEVTTMLFNGVNQNNWTTVHEAIQNGADVTATNAEGITALELAFNKNFDNLFCNMLRFEQIVAIIDKPAIDHFFLQILTKNKVTLLKKLLTEKLIPTDLFFSSNAEGINPLLRAAQFRNGAIIKLLITHGMNAQTLINTVDSLPRHIRWQYANAIEFLKHYANQAAAEAKFVINHEKRMDELHQRLWEGIDALSLNRVTHLLRGTEVGTLKNSSGQTPILRILMHWEYHDIKNLISNALFIIEKMHQNEKSLLLNLIIYNSDTSFLNLILLNNSDLNFSDSLNTANALALLPLINAAIDINTTAENKQRMIEALIRSGAKVKNVKDWFARLIPSDQEMFKEMLGQIEAVAAVTPTITLPEKKGEKPKDQKPSYIPPLVESKIDWSHNIASQTSSLHEAIIMHDPIEVLGILNKGMPPKNAEDLLALAVNEWSNEEFNILLDHPVFSRITDSNAEQILLKLLEKENMEGAAKLEQQRQIPKPAPYPQFNFQESHSVQPESKIETKAGPSTTSSQSSSTNTTSSQSSSTTTNSTTTPPKEEGKPSPNGPSSG